MGRILEELYGGSLQPAENRDWDNPEYEERCADSLEEVNEFCARLDEESREAFDQLMEHYLELTYLEKSETFCQGFRLGAGIMCEVFSENGREHA